MITSVVLMREAAERPGLEAQKGWQVLGQRRDHHVECSSRTSVSTDSSS